MAEIMKKPANMKKPMIAIRSKRECTVEDHGFLLPYTDSAADECTMLGPTGIVGCVWLATNNRFR